MAEPSHLKIPSNRYSLITAMAFGAIFLFIPAVANLISTLIVDGYGTPEFKKAMISMAIMGTIALVFFKLSNSLLEKSENEVSPDESQGQ